MNLRILETNVADQGSVFVTPAAASTDTAPRNLQDVRRERVCRVLGDSMVLDLELPASRAMQAIVLVRHNFSSSATWRRQLWSGPNRTGALVRDEGPELIEPPVPLGSFALGDGPLARNRFTNWPLKVAVDWFGRVTARSMRITIADPQNPAGYLELSRLMVGTYFSPTVNQSWGSALRWEGDDDQARSQGLSLLSGVSGRFRRLTFTCQWLSDSESSRMLDLQRRFGTALDTFVSLYPEDANPEKERDYMMAAKFASTEDAVSRFVGANQQQYTFLET